MLGHIQMVTSNTLLPSSEQAYDVTQQGPFHKEKSRDEEPCQHKFWDSRFDSFTHQDAYFFYSISGLHKEL